MGGRNMGKKWAGSRGRATGTGGYQTAGAYGGRHLIRRGGGIRGYDRLVLERESWAGARRQDRSSGGGVGRLRLHMRGRPWHWDSPGSDGRGPPPRACVSWGDPCARLSLIAPRPGHAPPSLVRAGRAFPKWAVVRMGLGGSYVIGGRRHQISVVMNSAGAGIGGEISGSFARPAGLSARRRGARCGRCGLTATLSEPRRV